MGTTARGTAAERSPSGRRRRSDGIRPDPVARPSAAGVASRPSLPVYPRGSSARDRWRRSQVEPRLLEIELSTDRAHRVVADDAVAAQPVHRLTLGLEQNMQELLVSRRLLLLGAVAVPRIALGEPVAPEAVEPAEPLRRLVPHPLLLDQLVDAGERGVGRVDAGLHLLTLGDAVLLEAKQPHHRGQRQALHHQRAEDDGEGEEDDAVSPGEWAAAVDVQG